MTWIADIPMLADDDGGESLMFVIVAVIVIVVVGGLVVKMLASHLFAQDEPAGPIGFTLHDLRQMLRSGQMTQAEYDKAAAMMVERMKKADANRLKPKASDILSAGDALDNRPGSDNLHK